MRPNPNPQLQAAAKADINSKINELLANNSAALNEKYISYHKNRKKFVVQINGKQHGYFWTIDGAREKKAEILRKNEIKAMEDKILELKRETFTLEKKLSNLIGEAGK
tara:strand:+ start:323 stop:646 length:324 start_codon:yes stop_codon:yes gene_type:complete